MRRIFPYGAGVDDLATLVSRDTRMLRAAYAGLGFQVPEQVVFQHSSRLNE